jgi:hypothetical protein
MFFFKRKKIVVDAFTKIAGIADLHPIKPSTNFLPDWWKSLPSSYPEKDQQGITVQRSTLKRCDGFTQFYKNGFVIPLWIDTTIKTTADGRWAYRLASNDTETAIDSHPRMEFGPEFNNFIHLKFHSPWLLTEKTGCQFYFAPLFWNQISTIGTYHIPPGIVNYKHQSSTHINLLFPKVDNEITIPASTPMAHIVPLTEKEVEIRCHVISKEEHHKLYLKNYIGSFLGNYKKNKKYRQSEKKCPFGF